MESLVYQHAVGGVVFAVGLWFAWRQGYVGASGKGLSRLVLLIGGLLVLLVLQGSLELAPMTESPARAFDGSWTAPTRLGTPIDWIVMIAYFVVILYVGTVFSREVQTTRDFFFGGQRFSAGLIAMSLVASLVGSNSFIKYSEIGFRFGTASTQTYLNDWFWMPLLLFGWLPLVYFSRVVSVPEYFELRFGRTARQLATALVLVYLVGQIGINLYAMGIALHALAGWDVLWSSALVAAVTCVYVTAGGQTSVIVTDLVQGILLLIVGLLVLWLGIADLGGPLAFWHALPRDHRTAFAAFNTDSSYPSVGIFWQDGMANTAMFYFLNQGILMRFLSARSVGEARKAALLTVTLLMPLAAVVVASGGWVGRALVHAGEMPADVPAGEIFFLVANTLARPGVFGLVLAGLTAALMSTVDTLVTAVAAVFVNDVVRPLRPNAPDRELLGWARATTVIATVVGVGFVSVFQSFRSIYEAHGALTAAVTPPLVVALLLGVFWRRATSAGAVAALLGGSLLMAASIVWPSMITPIAHGVPMAPAGPGWLGGMASHGYMRALFGLLVSAVLGVGVSLVTRPRPLSELRGFVWGTVPDAIVRYKGSPGTENESAPVTARLAKAETDLERGAAHLPVARLSRPLATVLGVAEGDLVYVSDPRRWLGGLRSTQAVVGELSDGEDRWVELGPHAHARVVRPTGEVTVQRLC